MNKKLAIAVVLASGLSASHGALACCAGSLIGKAHSIGSSISGQLTAMEGAIAAQLKMNAADMISGMESVRSAVTQVTEGTANEKMEQDRIRDQQKAAYETQKKLLDEYGTPPASVCVDAAQGAVTGAVAEAGRQKAKQAASVAGKRSSGYAPDGTPYAPGDAMIDMATTPSEKLDVKKLSDPTLSDEERAQLLARMADPNPPAPIDEKEAMKTPQGMLNVAVRRQRLLDVSAIQSLLETVFNLVGAVLPEQSGASANGEPVILIAKIGDAAEKNGWPNPAFHNDLQSMGETDALRTAVKQAALRNMILLQRLKLKMERLQLKAIAERQSLDGIYGNKISAVTYTNEVH